MERTCQVVWGYDNEHADAQISCSKIWASGCLDAMVLVAASLDGANQNMRGVQEAYAPQLYLPDAAVTDKGAVCS